MKALEPSTRPPTTNFQLANPFLAWATKVGSSGSVEPFALKLREISASLNSRASACGESSASCVTRVKVSAELSTLLTHV